MRGRASQNCLVNNRKSAHSVWNEHFLIVDHRNRDAGTKMQEMLFC